MNDIFRLLNVLSTKMNCKVKKNSSVSSVIPDQKCSKQCCFRNHRTHMKIHTTPVRLGIHGYSKCTQYIALLFAAVMLLFHWIV